MICKSYFKRLEDITLIFHVILEMDCEVAAGVVPNPKEDHT